MSHNPSLTTLQLAELGRLTSPSLSALHPLTHLSSLDLSRLGTPQGQVLLDEDVVALLERVGPGLAELTLDGNEMLTEGVLVDGVKKYCGGLRKLSLADCVEVHTEGVEALFGAGPAVSAQGEKVEEAGAGAGERAEGEVEGEVSAVENKTDAAAAGPTEPWSSPGLHTLNLHRLGSLSPLALSSILSHSGRTLRNLSLHSCDELDAPLLTEALPAQAPGLEVLDLSFVRATDNFVVQALLDGCERLRVLFLHGNNRVTAEVPRKVRRALLPSLLCPADGERALTMHGAVATQAGVQLRGLENAVHSEIPPDMPW